MSKQREKRASIVDVAKRAEVSRQTVSNVINRPETVLPATRERVYAAISELGYRANQSARRLRTQQTATVGIRVDDAPDNLAGMIYDKFLHHLTVFAGESGRRILLFASRGYGDEIAEYRALTSSDDVDAFIITDTAAGDPRVDWFIKNKIPFVCFGRPWGRDSLLDDEVPWVDVDGKYGVALGTKELRDRGCKRIGYVGWPSPSGTGEDRHLGWRETVTEWGYSEAEMESLSIFTSENIEGGIKAVQQFCTLDADQRPDGVVCASDLLAAGVLLGSNGTIPAIGFDNSALAMSLGFDSIEQPLQQVADATVRILDRVAPLNSSKRPGDSDLHILLRPCLACNSGLRPRLSAPALKPQN